MSDKNTSIKFSILNNSEDITSVKNGTLSNNSTFVITQQERLNNFLNSVYTKQQNYNPTMKSLIIYHVHPESGIGNMIRGYFTGFVIAFVTNRTYKSMN